MDGCGILQPPTMHGMKNFPCIQSPYCAKNFLKIFILALVPPPDIFQLCCRLYNGPAYFSRACRNFGVTCASHLTL
jgi:hypothetical protein